MGKILSEMSRNIQTDCSKMIEKYVISGIIYSILGRMAGINVYDLGFIDIQKFQAVTSQKIITNRVIITDNRIQHIIERRGRDFYDEYSVYFPQILADPDYIFKDDKENTALVCKSFVHKGTTVNLVLRLAVEGENPDYQNSVITAIKESQKRFAQRLRNNNPVYQKIDMFE